MDSRPSCLYRSFYASSALLALRPFFSARAGLFNSYTLREHHRPVAHVATAAAGVEGASGRPE